MTETLTRLYEPPEITRVDGRTVEMRAIRYGEVADIIEKLPDGTVDRYREAIAPLAFAGQTNSQEPGVLRRVNFLDEHVGGTGKLGYLLAAAEEPEQLNVTMRVLRSREADVEQLIEDGIDKLSIGFLPLRGGTRHEGDVRIRTRAHLVHVALVAEGAYSSSRVLAYRDAELERVAASAAEDAEHEMNEARAWVDAERDRWAHLRADS